MKKSTYQFSTKKEVRQLFWDSFPQFKSEYRTRKKQNDYSTDCRCSFVEFTDSLVKSGQISQKLSEICTLQ